MTQAPPEWRTAVLGVLENAENVIDEAKFRLKQRLGIGKLTIQPYLGHGTNKIQYLKGRVLRHKGITSPLDTDNWWVNLLNVYKRYDSDEIPDALLRASFGGETVEAVTDVEGYFYFELHAPVLPKGVESWYDVELELLDYPGRKNNPAEPMDHKATGKVIVPPADAQFGVISDIDDTVLRTDVLDLVAMARNTFLMNAHTRLPFEGVAAFYHALRHGGDGKRLNPIYYVSSSAWNLYDMLIDFFAVRGIPLGPLMLTDLGLTRYQLFSPSHREHKVKLIQSLLDTHPTLPFILIGDSSQRDPEIYLETITHNPGRILAAYIRDVTPEARDLKVKDIAGQAAPLGVEMLAVKDTVAAAVHAAEKGFIHPDTLPSVTENTIEDKKAPTPLEAAVKPKAAQEAAQPAPATPGEVVEKVVEAAGEVEEAKEIAPTTEPKTEPKGNPSVPNS